MLKIIGVIYPVPKDIAERLFNEKEKVFVKFLAHNSTKLAPKNKVIIYASHGSKKLIGEGIIDKVEFLTSEEVMTKYRDKLFLYETEFYAYIRRSSVRTSSREMLTLVLKKLAKYPKPIEYDKPITMAGQYLSSSEYNSLMQKEEE
jgi:hypothetical protein